jgi:hypothetical protein
MHVVTRLGRGVCRISHKDEGRRLGDGLGEGVVKDEAVHAALALGHVVCAHGDMVGLALAVPVDLLEANGRQLLEDQGAVVARCRGAAGACGGDLEATLDCRGRGGEGRAVSVGIAWVLEDAKVEGFAVRLDAPGDGVLARHVDPADEVRLAG